MWCVLLYTVSSALEYLGVPLPTLLGLYDSLRELPLWAAIAVIIPLSLLVTVFLVAMLTPTISDETIERGTYVRIGGDQPGIFLGPKKADKQANKKKGQ